MDGRSNVGIKKAEKVLCMVLAMLMAIVITINVSARESISKAKIDEYLYTIAYSQQEQVKEPIYGYNRWRVEYYRSCRYEQLQKIIFLNTKKIF